ncbi:MULTISPECIES: thioredoxin family protein [Cellvibrio]|jgi:glutaredoxin|uniref:Glutaredoxin n=1 Tax=Cellvibrio fibrivorans TaxID=126350 RepID=A0ABU1UUL8_9GAMM|nr:MULTISPECIES: thioredoxin family protein [Cellvibrio]MDR7088868.1 glutaredoxin [Cellvibrio fibrivorans]QEY11448.1 thioredoxin family protein [Cellvibrio sp. KY-YJ-3]
MKSQAIFYHAGCPVCVAAEHQLLDLVDANRVQVEVVHLGDAQQRVAEAKKLGVKSVPALVVDGQVLHINFGAAIEALE